MGQSGHQIAISNRDFVRHGLGNGSFDQQAAGMIAHLSIGVRDLERSKGFYDSALAPLGYRCLRPGRTMLGYGYGFLDVATCRIKFAEVSSPAISIRPSADYSWRRGFFGGERGLNRSAHV